MYNDTRVPFGAMNAANRINGVGIIPLIPLLWVGGAALLGGTGAVVGYNLAKPTVDPRTGQPMPGALERGAQAIGSGIGNAITWAAVLGVGYLIFLKETSRRGKR